MTVAEKNAAYFQTLTRSNWRVWVWSALAAMGMNLLLFLLMPHLMDPAPERGNVDTLVSQVNVVRVKRPDSLVQRKTPPPKPKKKELPKPQQMLKQPLQTKLTLPFELNPRLPGGPQTLAVPDWTSAPMQAGLAGALFSVGQLDAPLTTLVRIPPVYPIRARRRNIQGWVKVAFVVDENGHVGDITILVAEPEGLFENSVRRCVSGWRFKPGTVEGMPVKARVETVIRFELE